jgi:hypothetical protein
MPRILRLSLRSFCSSSVSTAAVVDERAGQRQHVERDRARVEVRLRQVDRVAREGQRARALGPGPHLLVELRDSGQAAAGDGLVGGGDEAGQPGQLVQRAQHRHRGHGGAVGVGDDALRAVPDGVRVHLGDDERNLRVHPPGRGVVHDDGPGRGDLRREHPGGALARREQHEVQAPVVGALRVLDHDPPVPPRQRAPGGAGRGEQAQLTHGEPAFGEQGAHDPADLAGGPDDSDPHQLSDSSRVTAGPGRAAGPADGEFQPIGGS